MQKLTSLRPIVGLLAGRHRQLRSAQTSALRTSSVTASFANLEADVDVESERLGGSDRKDEAAKTRKSC